MVPPTTAQQRGMAFAPIPFAAISFLSSSFMIYHLIFQERQKLRRLYHRLVLAMNFAMLPLSFANAWSTLAVPEGTPYFTSAMGTVNTCTTQGFMKMLFSLAVATYYASLGLQAFMGMRNNFQEEKYRWVEIPIHLVAYSLPCAFAIVGVVTENFNPNGSGCWYAKAPRGCESDPEVACERGEDVRYFVYVVGFSQIFLYFIYPPTVILAMHCWIKKIQKRGSKRCSGMSTIREQARREMMHDVQLQMSLYLFSFWSTWVLLLIHNIYQVLTGRMLYNLNILGNCIFALQGFVFMVVYFTLQKMGSQPNRDTVRSSISSRGFQHQLTVYEIRSNAKQKNGSGTEEACNNGAEGFDENNVEEPTRRAEKRFSFNIFDGEPDQDSPWAKFFDEESGEDEDDPDQQKQAMPNDET